MTRSTVGIARGLLLGTLVGDAIGAPFEGEQAVTHQRAHDRLERCLSAGSLPYTDDTQLTLALAEHLCDDPSVDPAGLVDRILDHFEDHRGYARGMLGVVAAWRNGAAPEAAATAVFEQGSFGNGAAMRVAPVGLVWRADPDSLADAARRQAGLTHAHPIGTDAAVAQARAVARAVNVGAFTPADLRYLADQATTDELSQALKTAAAAAEDYVTAPIPLPQIARRVGTGVLADQSVPAALWVAAVAQTFADTVVLALGLGGDVDTIAAMAGAVVGSALTDTAIPPAWLARMEDGPRGLTYTRGLAERLATAGDGRAAGRDPV